MLPSPAAVRARLLAIAMMAVVAGCPSDPNALNEQNLKPAVTAYLDALVASKQLFCSQVIWPSNPVYPMTEKAQNAEQLVARGWAKHVDCTPPQTSFIPPLRCDQYDLTDAGREAIATPLGGFATNGTANLVCHAAGARLLRITEWTPAAQMAGQTISTVRFEYQRSDLAPWAASAASDPFLRSYLGLPAATDETLSDELQVRLTSNGWTHESNWGTGVE